MPISPEPWWIEEDKDNNCLCICAGPVNEDGEREEIAVLYTNRPSLQVVQPANAAMIAAAPIMFSVLLSCLNRWDDLDEQDNPWLGQNMRDAIAKAEGRG